jgi:L-rhamnose mutarotase
MKIKQLFLLVSFCTTTIIYGFSPYENYLLSGGQKHVMLTAIAKKGKIDELKTALNQLKKNGSSAKLAITNLSFYTQKLQEKEFVFVYFDYDGKRYLNAVSDFESIDKVKVIKDLITPLPLATDRGNSWLQLEWINFIAAAELKGKPSSSFAMVTRIKPDKEKQYRILHQTTWPGIVDWMSRKGYHNFSIYMAYIGDEIYEFFYTETVEQDKKGTTIKNLENDKICKRWWKNTDSCQDPLPGADGVWLMMNKVK